LGKNSFTLFETLLSISILIFIISGFLNSTYYDEKTINNSNLLNTLENNFAIKDYDSFTTSNTKIHITKNQNQKEEVLVKKHSFENKDIKIYKYEK
jgi:hypothetical protein